MTELEKAKSAYPKAKPDEKKLLESIFGKEAFAAKITDMVKSYEDACKIEKIDPVKSLPYPKPKKSKNKDEATEEEVMNAFFKLRLIAKVLKKDHKKANWNDSSEQKHFPVFEYRAGSGFVFSCTFYYYSYTNTASGSRLSFPTAELAEYFGKQFINIHRIILQAN